MTDGQIVGARGRPLRFLALVTTGWVGLRTAMLWPQLDSATAVLHAIAPVVLAAAPAPLPIAPTPRATAPLAPEWHPAIARTLKPRAHRAADPTRVALALLGLVRYGDPQGVEEDATLLPGLPRPVRQPVSVAILPSRWSASLWLVARGGSGIAPGSSGGQLGGSQAGVRLAYLLDRKHRIALAGRVTTPLGSGLREAAVGIEWQPTRLPVRLVAEERIAIDGGRSGPALGVVGGIGPVAIPLGFRLEAYGQAGIIRRTDVEAYADGALRVARPIATIGQRASTSAQAPGAAPNAARRGWTWGRRSR